MPEVFSVPIFFIVFREALETVIIVSVLLAFLKQTLDGPISDPVIYRKLRNQVWWGLGLGVLVTLVIGGGLIGAFYGLGKNRWSDAEYYWEASFAIVASVIITIIGAGMLRISKMQEKWRVKIAQAFEAKVEASGGTKGAFKRFCEKYAMFILPFITVVREGLEGVVFVAGVSFQAPATAVPLPVVVGLLGGVIVGFIIFKGGASAKLQVFLVISTCLLYLVAAGLFSKAVWFLEAQKWNLAIGGDAAETGSGPGSYDITQSVWHLNYANPELLGGAGWGVFRAILGWQNSATYGSVISYNVYWIVVIIGFLAMRYNEVKGHWPLMKPKSDAVIPADSKLHSHSDNSSETGSVGVAEKKVEGTTVAPIRSIEV